MRAKDMSGFRFGRLIVKEIAYVDETRKACWLCICDCGNSTIVPGDRLRSGKTRSCGCYGRELNKTKNMKHGMFGTKVYGIWAAMIRRCRNKNDSSYKYYGERGIKVCDEWLNFENFYTDMGDPPDDHSIERKDHNGNYCKENCVWADWITQENNRTNNRIISYNGKKQTIAQWSREFNVRPGLISNRLYKGWTVEKALTCPVDIRQRKHLGRAGVKN